MPSLTDSPAIGRSAAMTISREDPRFWDVRTVERRVRRGQITRKEHEKYVKTLDDVANKAETISLAGISDDDDDDEDPTEAE